MEEQTHEEVFQESFEELLGLVEESKVDFDKYLNLGNQAARKRFRKAMQGIRATAFFLRKQIMEIEETRRNGDL